MGDSFIACGVCDVCKENINSAFCPHHEAYGFHPDYSGGMCEYLKSPEQRLHKLADNMSFEEGALVENVSVPYTGIWQQAGGVAGHDRVAIFGAGPIGLMAMLIAKVAHAQTMIVEPMSFRREMAEKLGAEVIIDPKKEDPVERIRHYTRGKGATLVIECSGSDKGLAATIDAAALDGRILLVGHSVGRKVPVEVGKLIWTGVRMTGTCAAYGFFPKVIDFMARKPIDFSQVITHRFPLTDILNAMEVGMRTDESMKIILNP
jgi:threonine dehydrogenase-like Zn-dependent dehydrogenase